MKKINRKTFIFILISLILFIIPFFWLKPGEMDLGGDSSRLYFYDPVSMIKTLGIYSIVPYAAGLLAYNQYFMPFLVFVALLKSIFISPTILIGVFNGFKLAGSFIFVFLILREFFLQEDREMSLAKFSASIIAALFYTLSPSLIDNMRYALVTHSQVFLNPMIFYLLLKYFIGNSFKYIWLVLLATLIFSTNFVLYNPPLYAFYPLAIIFIFFYIHFVLRKKILLKGIIIGALFFLCLHAFHIIPVTSNVFDKGSELNTRTFESASQINVGLDYFNAILPQSKVSEHLLLSLEAQRFKLSLIIIPVLMILGLISIKKKNRIMSLVSIFFLISLFLVSANITHSGVNFYRKLFLIPGFGMFRNFFGQWQWVYTFFYALLVGLSISHFFSRIKIKYIYLFSFLAIGFLIMRSWIVFNGDIVNVFNRGSKNIKVVIRMDPNYEKMLAYIKKIPNSGRILHMPFTDFAYNIVGGANKGVYVGQSMIALLAGKNDFSGYQDIAPFSEVFRKLSHEKDYLAIKQIMSMLQIRYVLYNSDEIVSEKFFPAFPYGYTGVPASQSALMEFVNNIVDKKIFESGYYSLFEVDKNQYLPNFYIASELSFYDINPKYDTQYSKALSFFPTNQQDSNNDPKIVYVDRQACKKIFSKETCSKENKKLDSENIQIIFQKINPTKYKIQITNAAKPFLLVFQNSFTPKWKLYEDKGDIDLKVDRELYCNGSVVELNFADRLIDQNPFQTNGLKPVFVNSHIEVNGYANAWYIDPGNSRKQDYNMIVEMTGQKMFYYSLIVSLITLVVYLLYGVRLFKK